MKDENNIKEFVYELRKRVYNFDLIKNDLDSKKYLIVLYEWFKSFDFINKILEKFFLNFKNDIEYYDYLNFLKDELLVNYYINNSEEIEVYKDLINFFIIEKDKKTKLLSYFNNLKNQKAYLPIFKELKQFLIHYFLRWSDFLMDLFIFKKDYLDFFNEKPPREEIINKRIKYKKNKIIIDDYGEISIYTKKNIDSHYLKKLEILFNEVSKSKNNGVSFNVLKEKGFTMNDFYRYISYINLRISLNPRNPLLKKNIFLYAKKDEKLSSKGNPFLKILIIKTDIKKTLDYVEQLT